MRIPDKLIHGDNLGNLFEKFNSVIDYLRAHGVIQEICIIYIN